MTKKIPRVEYGKQTLADEEANKNPFLLLANWWQEAIESAVPEIDAAHLATVDKNHHANGRIVLVKSFDETGLVFYSNYESTKAEELKENPYAALTFFWPRLERQIRLRGPVSHTSRKESEQYFKTRPKGAQLGAWASPQSSIIKNRDEIDLNFGHLADQFKAQLIPCPPNWGGFRLVPTYFEFWQGRPNRLHDRLAFALTEQKTWHMNRLAP